MSFNVKELLEVIDDAILINRTRMTCSCRFDHNVRGLCDHCKVNLALTASREVIKSNAKTALEVYRAAEAMREDITTKMLRVLNV